MNYWRERIFTLLFVSGCVLGLPLLLSLRHGILPNLFANLVLFGTLYAFALVIAFRRSLPFKFRLICGMAFLYALGLTSLIEMGPVGNGRVWLFTFSLATGLFAGARPAFLTIPVNAATLLLVSLFQLAGKITWPLELAVTGFEDKWLVIASTFVVTNAVTTLSLLALVRVLQTLLERERNLRTELVKREKDLESQVDLYMKTQTALEQSEKRYKGILESIEEGYYEQDLAGNFTFFNSSLCRIFGYSSEELMGMNFRQYTSPETAGRMRDIYKKLYETGQAMEVTEYSPTRGDGKPCLIEIASQVIRNDAGEITGFRGIARDVSRRRKVEEDYKKLENRLLQAQKLEAVGTLAGGVAHDFNNLLMGMQGNVSLMLVDADPGHPFFDRLLSLEQYIGDASGLTRQLLGFARSGKNQVQKTDINAVVEKTISMYGRTSKQISILTHPANVWMVEVDQGQIQQVLLNLLVNAGQAMPEGGRIRIETVNRVLDASQTRPHGLEPGRYVQVEVVDTGHGMDEATQAKVFDPFFTTKGMGRGTGLGLASAYGIMKNHGGFITVHSQPGCGATFSLLLPACEGQAEARPLPEKKRFAGKGTVLLVDDEEVVRQSVGPMLQALGYKPLLAESGEQALEIVERNGEEIDLVILDLIMPGMSGRQACQVLKKKKKCPKILLSSGYSGQSLPTDLASLGSDGFLEKPFDLDALSFKLHEILS